MLGEGPGKGGGERGEGRRGEKGGEGRGEEERKGGNRRGEGCKGERGLKNDKCYDVPSCTVGGRGTYKTRL